MSKKIEKSIELAGRTLTLTTGDVAQQANGAVMAKYGETVALATVVSAPLRQPLDYFPLTVEYRERLYAGGRIKGSRWVKREGRPTDEEILSARLIDRSIRPLFPKEYKKDVQVVITVLSVDLENPPEIVSAIAASCAIAISDIPWGGPVGIIKVGLKDKKLIVNPTEPELETSDLDLVVASTKDAVVMIEAGASQVAEEYVLKGIEQAQKECQLVIKLINDLAREVGAKKEAVDKTEFDKSIEKKVKEETKDTIKKLVSSMATKEAGYAEYDEVKAAVSALFEKDEEKVAAVKIFEDIFRREVRNLILSGRRPDGRKLDEIRPLSCEIEVLPRTHGSAIFNRGQTQALSIATLGAPSLEQFIETAAGEETKRYIHLYSMPPFSTGETGKMGGPGRREIGHGALAEKALLPVIPGNGQFPYTIQVVTEILSSNGSTSMAAVCGSTLSLMDAGVPIKAPVAGIAMGVVIEDKEYKVLTDIVGLEDASGDMDFKVAGTADGITALQLDVKTLSLNVKILKEALEQAKKARLEILEVMKKVIKAPRESVSKYAPKIKVIHINPEKIGELIGPGGKTIKKIIAETGAQIDVDDDGTVYVSGTTQEELENGISKVEAITKVLVAGEIYKGVVKRLQSFGAFVEVLPGKEGLVHVSDMSEDYIKDPSEILKIGQKVQVRVKGIDEMGRLNLSMMLDPAFDIRKEERRKEKGQERYFDKRGGQRGRERGTRDFRSSGGPHFPTSRFLDRGKKKY